MENAKMTYGEYRLRRLREAEEYAPYEDDPDLVERNGQWVPAYYDEFGEVIDEGEGFYKQPEEEPTDLPSGAPPEGYLGVQTADSGKIATVLNTTITSEEINNGRPTNIPLLVPGQINVSGLVNGARPTDEQMRIAMGHAIRRLQAGERIPGYDSIDTAVRAARAESARRGTINWPRGHKGTAR